MIYPIENINLYNILTFAETSQDSFGQVNKNLNYCTLLNHLLSI